MRLVISLAVLINLLAQLSYAGVPSLPALMKEKLDGREFLVGYMGETMFLNGGTYTRFYNMVFFRYNLL